MSFNEMSWDRVCRRAGGRRKYNALRQMQATIRRADVARLLLAEGHHLRRRGAQARVARRLGVSEATISRDVKAILRYCREHQYDEWWRLREVRRELDRDRPRTDPDQPRSA